MVKGLRRGAKYLAPAHPGARLPVVFGDTNWYRFHYCLMAGAFEPQFPGATYEDYERLVIERDPAAQEEDDRWWFDRGRGPRDGFAEAVADHPDLAAWMLEQCGVTYDDFQMALWAEAMDEEEGYRPLMAS